MNTEKKQLDSQLQCRATAELQENVIQDFSVKDRTLADILREESEKNEKETKDDKLSDH
jgi:hypothetical protein